MTGLVVLVVVAVAAVGFGLWRGRTDGRVVQVTPQFLPGVPIGSRATLVQFSSAVCSPCATARRVLAEVADRKDVTYVDLDVEAHLGLVERFDVMRTPTVLVLDSQGTVRHRIVGVPRREELDRVLVGYPESGGRA